jgi:hypothetical protein
MRKRKGGDERKQTLDARIYPVVSVGTEPLLVYVVESLTKSIVSRSPSIFRDSPWLATKTRPLRLTPSTPVTLMLFSLWSFPRRRGLVPRTKLSSPLHTKLEGRRLADEPRRLQEAGTPKLQLRFTQEPAQGIYTLLSHSNYTLLSHSN